MQQQISFEELEMGFAARVTAVHRDRIQVIAESGEFTIQLAGILTPSAGLETTEPSERATIGDWLWLETSTHKPLKLLERQSLLQRTAAGSEPKAQLIAANLDTVFLVSSCNDDFNLSRFERYLSLVMAAHIPAVIVLTKADLSADGDHYVEQAQTLHPDVPVFKVNALSEITTDAFQTWTKVGQTIAFLGSSGVGKSTLTNILMGEQAQDTAGIREDDAKGRHTTTNRSMHKIPSGGWVMDTPGMRELKLNDDAAGISELFDDIEGLMLQCKFKNCHHEMDTGCAVIHALEEGDLEERRWKNYLKLQREALRATQTKKEQHDYYRQISKGHKSFQNQAKRIKSGA